PQISKLQFTVRPGSHLQSLFAQPLCPGVKDTLARRRISNLSHHTFSKVGEAWNARYREVRSADCNIDIYVCDSVSAQTARVLFHPFSRADEAELFCVPACQQYRAAGLPAAPQQFAEAARYLQQSCRTALRICRARDPRISM